LRKSHPLTVGAAAAATLLAIWLLADVGTPLWSFRLLLQVTGSIVVGVFIAFGRFRARAGKTPYRAYVIAALSFCLLVLMGIVTYLTGMPRGGDLVPWALILALGLWGLGVAWRRRRQ
jgi:hypothetical protein